MRLRFHKNFRKQYKKLSANQQKRCDERLALFAENSYHVLLNNHALHGKHKHCRSINITGDLRAVFEMIDDDYAFFTLLDTHANLYE